MLLAMAPREIDNFQEDREHLLKMKISILCSNSTHPIYPLLEAWMKRISVKHDVELVTAKAELSGGDILLLIACHEIVSRQDREKYKVALVIHSSDLPEGRGWSPQIWQVLAGKNDIVVSLIEAHDKVDAGPIWAKRHVLLDGHELYDEINDKLFSVWLELMDYAVANAECPVPTAQDDREPTYWRKRTPEDSRLDPDRSIAEQFELLRVADPERYPAFFDFRGHRYFVRLSKHAGASDV